MERKEVEALKDQLENQHLDSQQPNEVTFTFTTTNLG